MDWTIIVSIILALTVPLVIWVGYRNRQDSGGTGKARGIGWQFIRYTVLGISLPIAAILALNGKLTGEAATLIAGAMGYAFGKAGEPEPARKRPIGQTSEPDQE